jgi:hypothetical protein
MRLAQRGQNGYFSRCPIKVNISRTTGERIYHLPGQRYYSRTRIDLSSGERWFCSEDAARAAGWRKARFAKRIEAAERPSPRMAFGDSVARSARTTFEVHTDHGVATIPAIMPIAIMQTACAKKNAKRMAATLFVCSSQR